MFFLIVQFIIIGEERKLYIPLPLPGPVPFVIVKFSIRPVLYIESILITWLLLVPSIIVLDLSSPIFARSFSFPLHHPLYKTQEDYHFLYYL